MPTTDVRTLDIAYLKELMRSIDFLFPIPEKWLPVFSPDEFEITFAEGDADYLYTVEKMSTFTGRRLHKKRNLLKQFNERYAGNGLPLTNDRLDDARFVLNEWLMKAEMSADETDYSACLEALNRYEELVLCGGIYYADNEPAGIVIGEELNEETFVLHFAKARIKFKGIYQYMFNNFAKILPPKYRYLNLEQDLDRENLRVFKSSYVPDVMLKKARVHLKADLSSFCRFSFKRPGISYRGVWYSKGSPRSNRSHISETRSVRTPRSEPSWLNNLLVPGILRPST
jgi:hypothetical protein